MVGFILEDLMDELLQTGLYNTIPAAQYGITQSNLHPFTMLERYNLETCTFFTPIGGIRFTLHEMYEVNGLAMETFPIKNMSHRPKNCTL